VSSRIPSVADLSGRFEGRLVVVEPLALAHEAGLFEAAQEGELFRWMPLSIADSPAQLHAWVQRSLEAARDRREVPFAVLDAATGAPIGSTRFLEIRLEHLRIEIGWTWMARRVWGEGHNVETKLLLISHALERVGCRRVEFKTDARNERSRGALLALGATFEGVLRKHMVVRDGAARDSAYYSIIDDDWPRVKVMLQRRLAAMARDP
jgi:RimJ/RimL family protein N-acetyltransferase